MNNIENELTAAVESDDIKMAEAVFNSGEKFNINLQSSNGDTLLHMVKSPEMAELLLKMVLIQLYKIMRVQRH